LPLLVGACRLAALQAVILNQTMILIVVASALPFWAARGAVRRGRGELAGGLSLA
jgi:hypothetical protein